MTERDITERSVDGSFWAEVPSLQWTSSQDEVKTHLNKWGQYLTSPAVICICRVHTDWNEKSEEGEPGWRFYMTQADGFLVRCFQPHQAHRFGL